MSNSEELANELRILSKSIGNAGSDISAASKQASNRINAIADSLRGFSATAKQSASSILSAENDFQKFDNAITTASNSIQKLSIHTGRASAGIKAITILFEKAFKATTDFNQRLTGLYDGFSSLGITAAKTTDQILSLTHQAGYYLKNSKDLAKLVEETGTSLTSLGKTTASGADRLAKIFNNINYKDVQEDFLKLGLGPKELNKIQVAYLKQQSMVGLRLTANDDLLRESSVQYAKTLTQLSALTGESRDKLAEEMAQQKKDIRYQLKIQELVTKGNQRAIDEFDKATASVGVALGADFRAGLTDFIASGTATTKQGEMLLYKTGGRIAKWVRMVEEGKMDSTELAKRIADAEYQFAINNKEALSNSDQFKDQMYTTGDTFAGAIRLREARGEEDIKNMVDAATKREDDLKSTQDVQLRTERITSQAMDKFAEMLSSTGNDVILGLVSMTKQLARGVIKLALMLPIEGNLEESLTKMERILSDNDQLEDSKKKLENQIKELDSQQRQRVDITKQLEEAKNKLKEAEERKPKLEQEIRDKPTDDLVKETAKNNEIEIERKRREIEILKRKEKELEEKRTKQQLEQDRKRLENRKREIEQQQRETTRPKPEPKKPTKPEERDAPTVPEGKTDLKYGNDERILYPKLSKIRTKDGVEASVDARFAKNFQAFVDELTDTGYKIRRIDGFAVKQVRKTGKWSAHTYGLAIDINPQQNWGNLYTGPQGVVQTDMPDYFQDIAKKHRLGWGHKWTGDYKDSMHFSGIPAEGGSLVKGKGYKTGGIAKGPSAGYPVTLHGTEAILPFNNKPIQVKINEKNVKLDTTNVYDELAAKATEMRQKLQEKTKKVDLNNRDTSVNFGEITSNIKAKIINLQEYYQENQEDTVDISLAESLVNKIETMIKSVERSSSIHNDLKMYLRN